MELNRNGWKTAHLFIEWLLVISIPIVANLYYIIFQALQGTVIKINLPHF